MTTLLPVPLALQVRALAAGATPAQLRVIAEAATWLGTPFVPEAAKRGVGVDCLMLPIRVYAATGNGPELDPRPYGKGWYRGAARYRRTLRRHATLWTADAPPPPAALVLFKLTTATATDGAHGGIVVAWPVIIHAHPGFGVIVSRADDDDLRGDFREAWVPHGLAPAATIVGGEAH